MKNIDDNKHTNLVTIKTYKYQLKNGAKPFKMTS